MSEDRIRRLEERTEGLESSHRTQATKLQEVDGTARRADDNANEAKRIANDAVATMNATHRSIVEHVGRAVGGVSTALEGTIGRLDEALNKRLDKQDETIAVRLDKQDEVQSEHGSKLDAIRDLQVERATREETLATAATNRRAKIMSGLKITAAVLAVPPALVGAVVAFHAIGVWLHHILPTFMP